ncbi:MAG: RND transporter [Acidobacteria bacterium]|nr:MAG: RND transporter [Acidobacteriota bacterium]
MDIPRKNAARNRRIRYTIYTLLVAVVVGVGSLAISRLKPAAPTVERATVWIDTVKRGPMLRNVRGLGTLVPEEIRWVSAVTQGRVERRLVQPGARVRPDTVLILLSNPDLENSTLNAEWDYKAAEASLIDLKVRLESSHLNQTADAARVEADYEQAKLRAEADTVLSKQGLIPELTLKLEQVTAEQLANRIKIEKKRLEIDKESIEAQLAVQRARVAQLRAVYQLRKSQLDQLKVRAGVGGILQLIPVEEGAQVLPGANLARVADPTRLKAELKIAETQTKDVVIGQVAQVDTRNGIIDGHVIRIDPSVQNGTRTVDVALDGELPKGAVPDLSVDGTIELEKLTDVVYVGRPVQGQAFSTITLFRLEPDDKMATRVQVKLGRTSVNTIEIVEGLKPGDQVILSDMAQHDNTERIELK